MDKQIGILKQMKDLCERLMKLLVEKKKVTDRLEPDKGWKVYMKAKELLGKKFITTNPDLGCADACNYVVRFATGESVGGGASTFHMHRLLKEQTKRFEKVIDPKPGDIVISPTGYGKLAHGHVGIVGEENKIMSNNSKTGKWDDHYTLWTWETKYKKNGGFPMEYYRLI